MLSGWRPFSNIEPTHTRASTSSVSSMVHGKSFERFAKTRATKNSVGNTERIIRPAIYLSNNIGHSITAEGGNGVLVLYEAAVRIAECGRESESKKPGI
jgi:hypothetical protein